MAEPTPTTNATAAKLIVRETLAKLWVRSRRERVIREANALIPDWRQ
jgi:hypothetical protein